MNIPCDMNKGQWRMGEMKFSPDGQYLADVSSGLFFQSFKFNNITGVINYYWGLYGLCDYYGVEFSPDISKLYITDRASLGPHVPDMYQRVWQIDLKAGDTNAIKNSKTYIARPGVDVCGCQIAIDKKIYITGVGIYLDVINHPNAKGLACGYQQKAITYNLNTSLCNVELPDYVQSCFFLPDIRVDNFCYRDTTFFSLDDTTLIDSVKWTFDDLISGSTNFSSSKKAVHVFSDTGIYHIRAIVFGDTVPDTLKRQIYISPYPGADFYINDSDQCFKGNKFILNDTSSTLKSSFEWDWNFGDYTGDIYTKNCTHVFSNPGTYQVSLAVLSEYGCLTKKTKNVYVYPSPSATFNVNDSIQCLNENSFSFTNNSMAVNCRHSWSFGDGATDTIPNPVYTYLNSGTFKVKQLCATDKACSDSFAQNIYINPSPTAKINITDTVQCLRKNSFVFKYIPSPFNDFANWDLGDYTVSTDFNLKHTYSNPDTFIINLKVENNFGCKDSSQRNVVVNPSPLAGYTVNDSAQCFKNNQFSFKCNNYQPGSNFTWSFGDGNNSTQNDSAVYSYLTFNTFTTKLVVVNSDDCKDSFFRKVKVFPSADATFLINDTVQCLKQNNFVFNHNPLSAGEKIKWNISDGTKDSVRYNLNHIFTTSGAYSVRLIITNQNKCNDTMQKKITVYPSPDATFTVDKSVQCLNRNSYNFNCIKPAFAYQWDFGDTTTASNKAETHSYLYPQVYSIKLITYTTNNCSDTANQMVLVKRSPEKPVISGKNPLCENETMNLKAISTLNSSYQWVGENGFKSNLQNPVISNVKFSDSGSYTVKSLLNGCESDSTLIRIVINPNPDFRLRHDTTICKGDVIILDPGYFEEYLWQDSSTDRIYKVTQAGKYHLIVKNAFGCQHSESVNILEQCPTAIFIPNSFTPNNDGLNDYFHIVGENITDFKLIIYNRWGQKVFESNSLDYEWDGTSNHLKCAVGVYYFYVSAQGNNGFVKNVSGTITLVR